MGERRTTPLTRLRRRPWRLAALVLWFAVFSLNLAAAFAHPVLPVADPAICAEHDTATPLPKPTPSHAMGPHCPLCHVFSAGVLAPPSDTQVLVLAPSGERTELATAPARAPRRAVLRASAQPRAPPAFV
jgi:hypothetical protein